MRFTTDVYIVNMEIAICWILSLSHKEVYVNANNN